MAGLGCLLADYEECPAQNIWFGNGTAGWGGGVHLEGMSVSLRRGGMGGKAGPENLSLLSTSNTQNQHPRYNAGLRAHLPLQSILSTVLLWLALH